MIARILVVAGSDSGGGAGIQADIKTVMALGGYATTAITALTAQNTLGVAEIRPVDAAFVRRQMAVVLDDIGADAVKTGMLPDASVVEAVAAELSGRALPLVVDPVLVSTSGTRLVDDAGIAVLKARLMPMATVLTPNIPEAEALLGRKINGVADMATAAAALRRSGPAAVLLKGGHLAGPVLADVLATEAGVEVLEGERIDSTDTHGTGCTLASAIATGLAQGMAIGDAVGRARAFVVQAIRAAPRLGRGCGPLGHGRVGAAPI